MHFHEIKQLTARVHDLEVVVHEQRVLLRAYERQLCDLDQRFATALPALTLTALDADGRII